MIITKPKKQLSFPKLLAKAQRDFNKYIRLRDKDKGCISCGASITEAGHYFSAGHYSALRFNEINVNGQCTQCNCFLSGNLIHYRNGLINRYGEQKILLLESTSRHAVKKWERFELSIIIQEYNSKIKTLQAA
jgi:hypothetical protein